jgi:hypothetical protein
MKTQPSKFQDQVEDHKGSGQGAYLSAGWHVSLAEWQTQTLVSGVAVDDDQDLANLTFASVYSGASKQAVLRMSIQWEHKWVSRRHIQHAVAYSEESAIWEKFRTKT